MKLSGGALSVLEFDNHVTVSLYASLLASISVCLASVLCLALHILRGNPHVCLSGLLCLIGEFDCFFSLVVSNAAIRSVCFVRLVRVGFVCFICLFGWRRFSSHK